MQLEPMMSESVYKHEKLQSPAVLSIPNAQLKMRTLVAITGRSRSTLYALIAKGEFPAQIRDGRRCSRWIASEVSRWLDEHAQGSANGEGGE